MKKILTVAFLAFSVANPVFAGSATWKSSPATGDWNTAANWSPATVPNGPSDVATFASSNVTNVTVSANTEINAVVLNPGNQGASAFTITVSPTTQSTQFTISGDGITNNTGVTQNFVVAGPNVSGGPFGNITFLNTANAGLNDIHFTLNGGPSNTFRGGEIIFSDHSNAGSAIFTVNGGSVRNGSGGFLGFYSHASAGNATLTALAGTKSDGGEIIFFGRCDGGTARIQLFGTGTDLPTNGILDISAHTMSGGGAGPVTVGSIEGSGTVLLGPSTLITGSNNLNTVFSGLISFEGSHGGVGGGLIKIGRGTLALTHANTYDGETKIERGELQINNGTGSGTGNGPVQVDAGKLGGKGMIAGAVTVGNGTTAGAILLPGTAKKPGTLTINNVLTFNSPATYKCVLNRTTPAAGKVSALGVTINSGATFTLVDTTTGTLTPGTAFTVINNTSASPIAGTFVNLPDGGTFTSGGNTFKANYEGGDENDLTLTVQ